jgi:hypothetical protein
MQPLPPKKEIRGPRKIRLTDFLEEDSDTLTNLAFIDCEIIGPTILAVKAGSLGFSGNKIRLPKIAPGLLPPNEDPREVAYNAMFWDINPAERPWVMGVVFLQDCAFQGCALRNIAWAGDDALMNKLRAQIAPT